MSKETMDTNSNPFKSGSNIERRSALRLLGAGIAAPFIFIPRQNAQARTAIGTSRGAAPSITGAAAIVIDAKRQKVLYTKNADTRRPVASTQKLLTALLAVERGGLTRTMTIASSDTQVEPTIVYLKAGLSYRRADVIKALLVKSGNDAARALARDHSGSQEAFARAMNERAKKLGMRNSHFVTANGLPAPGQYSTARDIGILGLAAYKNSTIRSCTNSQTYAFRHPDGRVSNLSNTNKLLGQDACCNGMKTGYTRASGKCLVSSGSYGGNDTVVVILGSSSTYIWNDSKKLIHWALGIA